MWFESSVRASACGALLAASLVACGGGGGSTDFPPIPHCEAVPPWVIDPQATLVAPAKGATGVPTNAGSVSFTVGDPALRQGETLTVASVSANPDSFNTTAITTTNGGVMSAPLPTLKPSTQYHVTVTAPLPPDRQTECKTQILGDLGTFTTQ